MYLKILMKSILTYEIKLYDIWTDKATYEIAIYVHLFV